MKASEDDSISISAGAFNNYFSEVTHSLCSKIESVDKDPLNYLQENTKTYLPLMR